MFKPSRSSNVCLTWHWIVSLITVLNKPSQISINIEDQQLTCSEPSRLNFILCQKLASWFSPHVRFRSFSTDITQFAQKRENEWTNFLNFSALNFPLFCVMRFMMKEINHSRWVFLLMERLPMRLNQFNEHVNTHVAILRCMFSLFLAHVANTQ
jgi:hypothetical protein